jgi:hypothetical protein
MRRIRRFRGLRGCGFSFAEEHDHGVVCLVAVMLAADEPSWSMLQKRP